MAKEYTNLFPFQVPPKVPKNGTFGLKINHLASLLSGPTYYTEGSFLTGFLTYGKNYRLADAASRTGLT
jgi:hypothetical protein